VSRLERLAERNPGVNHARLRGGCGLCHFYGGICLAACQRDEADSHQSFGLARILLQHALIAMRHLGQPAGQRACGTTLLRLNGHTGRAIALIWKLGWIVRWFNGNE
jgi:hypothetical protein